MSLASFQSLDPFAWFLASVAAFCIGLTKAGFGGFGLIAVFLMTLVMPAKESTGAVVPMLIAADLMAIWSYHRHVSWKDFWGLLPATFFGMLSGWLLMSRIPGPAFGHFLGWIILSMMVLVVWQRMDQRILSLIVHHPVLTSISGFLAGITTMVANAGGPAMTFFLMAKKFDKMAFVGTCAWFFFVTNVTKIPLSLSLGLISERSLRINIVLLPAIITGMIVGRLLIRRIPQKPFEVLIVVMATASAIKLIIG